MASSVMSVGKVVPLDEQESTVSSSAAEGIPKVDAVAKVIFQFPENPAAAIGFAERYYANLSYDPSFECTLADQKVSSVLASVAANFSSEPNYFDSALSFRKVKESSRKAEIKDSPSMDELRGKKRSADTDLSPEKSILRPLKKCEKCQGGARNLGQASAGVESHPKNDAFLGTPGDKPERFIDADGSQISWLSDAGRFTLFEWEQYKCREIECILQGFNSKTFEIWRKWRMGLSCFAEISAEDLFGLYEGSEFVVEPKLTKLALDAIIHLDSEGKLNGIRIEPILDSIFTNPLFSLKAEKKLQVFLRKHTASHFDSVKKYADSGNVLAMYQISKYYESIDKKLSLDWLKNAASQGYVTAQIDLGSVYYLEKDYPKAAEWYEKAAKQGNPSAQNYMGEIFHLGYIEDQPNYQKAFEYYEKAAHQGYMHAQHNLGILYHLGLIGKIANQPNYQKAVEWYEKAANQGHQGAKLALQKLLPA
jgi:tetratricopeptide (TPR) repeat protein